MLQQYHGEFLINPVPLEMSMSPCSHACAYCFSRRAGYRGWTGYKSFAKTLDRALSGQSDNGLSRLLRDRYPVCLSNRSDPFSRSNQADTAQVLAALNANDIPVFFQTKGGVGAIEAAEKQPKSVWYVSISFWDDSKRVEMEPGAPTIAERIELIRRLRSLGHEVLVGINPLVPAWLGDDYKPLLDACAQMGVWGILVQRLHLAPESRCISTEREREVLAPYFADARKRTRTIETRDYARAVLAYCDSLGLHHYPPNIETIKTEFYDVFSKVYQKTFPTNQDFLDWCVDNKAIGDEVTFDEYYNVLKSKLPEGLWNLDHNVHTVARNIASGDQKIPRYMTYKDLLKIIWGESKHSCCPANYPCFSPTEVTVVDKWAGQELLLWRKAE